MKANGIARLGLGCAFALSINTVHAATLGEPSNREIIPDPAVIPDAAGEWFELYNPAAAPFNLNGTTLGDDGGDLHRIETDLLIPPVEYLTLVRSAPPGSAPGFVDSSFTFDSPGDEVELREPLGDVLRLDNGAGDVVGTPGFAGSVDLMPLPAGACLFAPALFARVSPKLSPKPKFAEPVS